MHTHVHTSAHVCMLIL